MASSLILTIDVAPAIEEGKPDPVLYPENLILSAHPLTPLINLITGRGFSPPAPEEVLPGVVRDS